MAATTIRPLSIKKTMRTLLAMLGRTDFHFLNDRSTGTTIGFFNGDEATSPCITTFLYSF